MTDPNPPTLGDFVRATFLTGMAFFSGLGLRSDSAGEGAPYPAGPTALDKAALETMYALIIDSRVQAEKPLAMFEGFIPETEMNKILRSGRNQKFSRMENLFAAAPNDAREQTLNKLKAFKEIFSNYAPGSQILDRTLMSLTYGYDPTENEDWKHQLEYAGWSLKDRALRRDVVDHCLAELIAHLEQPRARENVSIAR
jgi:hypothetical protein